MTPTHNNTLIYNNYNLNSIQRELDFNSNINANQNISTNANKFNLNPNFIPPYSNFVVKYSQTPHNGIKSMSFCNNIFPNNFVHINNNNTPLELKANNLNNKIKNPISDLKFPVKEEPLDFKINQENTIIGKDKRTTIMLRNIPNKYTLANLVDEINNIFLGKIDYINLPIDYEVNNFKINFIFLKILEKIKSRICFH